MTTPGRGTPRPSAVPASQNTAPVAEFRCLFTHDTRKKQKKWQDGYLKFHSFNSRVIVYDASRFTVGDTYYKDSNELHEGDELMLDKGVMVEVAEPVGITQTDLTPLLERKPKDPPQRDNTAPQRKPAPRSNLPPSNSLRAASQLRHKSLNALLGTPRGPIGKATPIRSPFEERAEQENRHLEERATKRQKTTHEGQPQHTPTRARPGHTVDRTTLLSEKSTCDTHPRPQVVPHGATVISLSSQPEADHIHSDVTLPRTPAKSDGFAPPLQHPTPKLPKGKVPVPHIKAQQTPRPRAPPSSPPVSASNRIANVDFAIQPARGPLREPSPVLEPREPQPVERMKTKSLKLSTGVKRGMLLCQTAPTGRRTTDGVDLQRANQVRNSKDTHSQQDRHHQRLSKDSAVRQAVTGASGRLKGDATSATGSTSKTANFVTGTENTPTDIPDDMGMAHGFMDQQLLVTPSPPHVHAKPSRSQSPILPTDIVAKRPTTKKTKGTRNSGEVPAEASDIPRRQNVGTNITRKKQTGQTISPVISRLPSSPVMNICDEETGPSTLVAPFEPEEQPRTSSALTSPSKLAFSTGGFKKKPRRLHAHSTAPKKPDTVPPWPTSAALPPHPLRSSKNGPLMSTTELSALLINGPKSMRLEDDPIDDSTQGDGNASLSKRSSGFTRTRSENDAPIPSTSEEWEQRNLPKPADSANPSVAHDSGPSKSKGSGLAALVKRTDPRHRFKRTKSLNVDTPLANAVQETPEVVSPPPVDRDVGPWSTEAFDLFDWKPPGKEWKVEGSKMKLVDIEADQESGGRTLIDGQ